MNANILDQVVEAISQPVNELPRNVTSQMTNLQINRRIASDDNEHDVGFGQTEPVPADEQRAVNIHHQTMTIKSFAIVILLLALFLSCIRLPPSASPVDTEETPPHDTLTLVASDDAHQDALELEKNGAASNEASHPTFEHISEETSPSHPSEKFI